MTRAPISSPVIARSVTLVLVVTLVAACSSGGGSGGSGSSSVSHTATTNSTTTADPGCKYIVASTGSRYTPQGTNLEYLVNAVAEPTACYDKVTFTFDRGNGDDLPPGYTVEYRAAPFGLEGVASSTAGFKDAKVVLYVEFRPTSTVDLRTGRSKQMYNGNLRLLLNGMRHTVIVEWLKDLAPSPEPASVTAATLGTAGGSACNEKASSSTTSSAPSSTSTTTTTKPKSKSTTTSSSTTTTAPLPTTSTSVGTIDVSQQRVVWLIGLDECRPFTVDAANQPPRVTIAIMN